MRLCLPACLQACPQVVALLVQHCKAQSRLQSWHSYLEHHSCELDATLLFPELRCRAALQTDVACCPCMRACRWRARSGHGASATCRSSAGRPWRCCTTSGSSSTSRMMQTCHVMRTHHKGKSAHSSRLPAPPPAAELQTGHLGLACACEECLLHSTVTIVAINLVGRSPPKPCNLASTQ